MKKIMRVACGMSGGVDSSVAALLLKQKGYDVVGVFMRNWDDVHEDGICMASGDLEDAQKVCQRLKIKLFEVNFVKEYWNYVFSEVLNDYRAGYTPNPDIMCNHHIKFDAFYKYALQHLQVDAIAMGHYARTNFGPFLENFQEGTTVKLLKGADRRKDQSFFLSRVPQEALRHCLFPLGHLHKTAVRQIATNSELLQNVASKPDSVGMCFVGERHFPSFIDMYLEPASGDFIDIDTGRICGTHNGIHQWTLGQRCNIPGLAKAYFVAHKDVETQTIYVAAGTDHLALYADQMLVTDPHWIAVDEPELLFSTGCLKCDFRFQHGWDVAPCQITKVHQTGEFDVKLLNGPQRALTPGQFAVFYIGDECIGSTRIKTVLASCNGSSNLLNLLKNHRAS